MVYAEPFCLMLAATISSPFAFLVKHSVPVFALPWLPSWFLDCYKLTFEYHLNFVSDSVFDFDCEFGFNKSLVGYNFELDYGVKEWVHTGVGAFSLSWYVSALDSSVNVELQA